jgi:hypothetical protein
VNSLKELKEEDPWYCALCIFDRANAEKKSDSSQVILGDCPHSDCKATGISDRTCLVLHMQRRCTQITRLLASTPLSSTDIIGDAPFAKKPITARQKAKQDGSSSASKQQQQQQQQSLDTSSLLKMSTGLKLKWGKRGRPPMWAYTQASQEVSDTISSSSSDINVENKGKSTQTFVVDVDDEAQKARKMIKLSMAARKKLKTVIQAKVREIERGRQQGLGEVDDFSSSGLKNPGTCWY